MICYRQCVWRCIQVLGLKTLQGIREGVNEWSEPELCTYYDKLIKKANRGVSAVAQWIRNPTPAFWVTVEVWV